MTKGYEQSTTVMLHFDLIHKPYNKTLFPYVSTKSTKNHNLIFKKTLFKNLNTFSKPVGVTLIKCDC